MPARGKGKGTGARKAKAPPALTGEDLDRMRAMLDGQRILGGDSYPPTVERLFELAGVEMSDAALKLFVAKKNEKLFSRTATSSKKEPRATENGLVFFPEDAAAIAGSPEIFERALEAGLKTGGDIFTPAELTRLVPKVLQKPFKASVDTWAKTRKAPFPGIIVARRKSKSKTEYFIHRLESQAPTVIKAVPGARDFARDFAREFERLDRATGSNNYVLLHDLRRALPDVDRSEFDRRLKELRLAKLFTLDSPDGRHVRLTPEQLDAGIREGSSNLVYVARR